jgi:hypothetical protein
MFFTKNKNLEKIKKDLEDQKQTINAYISKLSDLPRQRIEWCTVHGRECQSTGLLMWEKDLDLRYTFLNDRKCNDFFKTSLAYVKRFIGLTTSEALVNAQEKTGCQNTFAYGCSSTDMYTLEQNKSCRFWEIGYIGDDVFIIDATKIPIIKNGKTVGVRAWALNNSSKECEVHALLKMFLKEGIAKPIYISEEYGYAAYLINKTNDPFNRKFPK